MKADAMTSDECVRRVRLYMAEALPSMKRHGMRFQVWHLETVAGGRVNVGINVWSSHGDMHGMHGTWRAGEADGIVAELRRIVLDVQAQVERWAGSYSELPLFGMMKGDAR